MPQLASLDQEAFCVGYSTCRVEVPSTGATEMLVLPGVGTQALGRWRWHPYVTKEWITFRNQKKRGRLVLFLIPNNLNA